jgi:uncharacterized protein YgbK (DUF1537 family)
VLPVGGADFFEAILQQRGRSATRRFITTLADEIILFVNGSASAYGHEMVTRAQRRGIAVCAMPVKDFNGSDRTGRALKTWESCVIDALSGGASRAMVTIGQPLDLTPGAAERIQGALAEVVAGVLGQRRIANLLVSGGATASALCRRMQWRSFAVSGELTSGVVQMETAASHGAQQLIIKPGSYRWPDAVWD